MPIERRVDVSLEFAIHLFRIDAAGLRIFAVQLFERRVKRRTVVRSRGTLVFDSCAEIPVEPFARTLDVRVELRGAKARVARANPDCGLRHDRIEQRKFAIAQFVHGRFISERYAKGKAVFDEGLAMRIGRIRRQLRQFAQRSRKREKRFAGVAS